MPKARKDGGSTNDGEPIPVDQGGYVSWRELIRAAKELGLPLSLEGSSAVEGPIFSRLETASGLTDTYARSSRATFRSGRKWLFAGDSITNGSAASNFAYSYSRQACHMAGTLYAASDSIEAGTSGYTSTPLLAFLPTLLSTYSPDAVHIQIGTNDAGTGLPLSTFSANILAITALVKAAGISMTIGTVPPRSSNSAQLAASRPFIAAYNMWLRMWAPGAGIELADIHPALADPTTGDYLAAYDSGDGVHPNDAGHREIARVVSAAMLRTMPTARSILANTVSTYNLVVNPLMAGTTTPTSSVGGVATGTAPTNTCVADTSGVLPFGKWAQIDLDAGAASIYGRDFGLGFVGANWAVGDTLGLVGLIQVQDVTGGGAWDAAVAAGTAVAQVALINQAGTNVRSWGDRCAGRVLSAGIYNIGPFFTTLVVPAGTTSMTYRYQVNAPNGLHVQARFGTLGVFNLTTLGISGGGAAMINVDGP